MCVNLNYVTQSDNEVVTTLELRDPPKGNDKATWVGLRRKPIRGDSGTEARRGKGGRDQIRRAVNRISERSGEVTPC